ncbi:hypothetical protein U1Q18_017573 [Sarracenia purpurea var. burkii]
MSEGARLRTRWALKNRLNRRVAEAISEVVFAERINRTGAEGAQGRRRRWVLFGPALRRRRRTTSGTQTGLAPNYFRKFSGVARVRRRKGPTDI